MALRIVENIGSGGLDAAPAPPEAMARCGTCPGNAPSPIEQIVGFGAPIQIVESVRFALLGAPPER